MAKKIYVCTDISAKDVFYEKKEGCGIDADNVQDALDIMCDKLNNEVRDKYFSMAFFDPLKIWDVEHDLNKMVSVTLEDLDGNDIEGDVEYVSVNQIKIWFSQPVAGWVYVN